MSDDLWRGFEEAIANAVAPPQTQKGKLGYVINGQRRIDVENDPSRVYVLYPSGAYGRVLHKNKVRTSPVDDYFGMRVITGKDEQGYDAIIGIDSTNSAAILHNRGVSAQARQHNHSLDDIEEVGTFAPTAGAILFGNGTVFNSIQLEAALDIVLAAASNGFVKRTGTATYEIVDASEVFDVNTILTANGEVLVANGNVLVSG